MAVTSQAGSLCTGRADARLRMHAPAGAGWKARRWRVRTMMPHR